jgi:succinate dehydrogenase / fumarate reductase, cytochrome b subunit
MSAPSTSRQAFRSTVGLKIAMAVTGLLLLLFVLQHLVGNLKVFGGQEAFNAYAEFMQSLGLIKWGARFGLLAVLAVHVVCALALRARNAAARPTRYAVHTMRTSKWYGRTMMVSGVIVLVYLAYHIAHFTGEIVNYEQLQVRGVDGLLHRDIYTNFVRSLSNPVIGGFYIVGNVALALHLAHGASSMLRTLGLSQGRFKPSMEKVGPVLGLLVGAGNVSMPLACMVGLLS